MSQRSPFSGLPRFSLDRRITVSVLLVSSIVVGAITALSLPIELLPQGYTPPFLRISIPWRDAPPREVLDKITEPLEEELATVKGVQSTVSVSSTGSARVFMTLKQNTDMDVAYREVRDRIERARREFPEDVDRIFVTKDDLSGIPVSVLGVAVDPDVADTYNLIQKNIILPLERIDGVANVQANGLEEKEILIELDRDRTEASGLNIYDLGQQLGGDSFTLASGHVLEGDKKLLLRSVARYASLDELENRLVSPTGVRLKDIATVRYEEPDKLYRVRAMSRPAYAIIVFKEGDANATDVCARVEEVFNDLNDDPRLAQVEMIMLWDQGETIKESLRTLLRSGAIGGLVAGFVLFFFLRRVRATAVVTLSVPISLLIALMVMAFAGETLNILTLLALMVSVGLLVDNSVVVAENIDRLSKLGKSKREAAISGAGEIALAITMSTLTTVVVFLPVSLVEGPGQFFLLRMAIPITVALTASLFVALIYIPLSVYLTLPEDRVAAAKKREGTLTGRVLDFNGRLYEWTFGAMNRTYHSLLARCLNRRLDLVIGVMAAALLTVLPLKMTGLKFVDVQENEESGFYLEASMPDNFTLEETEEWFLKAEELVENHAPEWGLEGWFLWHEKTDGELQGWFTTPRTNKLSPRELTEEVIRLLPKQPGMKVTTGRDQSLDEEDNSGRFRVVLNGDDPGQLDAVAEDLESFFVRLPGVLGLRSNDTQAPNEMALVVDRERAQNYDVNPQTIAGLVAYALRGQALPKYRDAGREVPVRVRFRESDRDNLDALSSFLLPNNSGELLPVSALTDVRMLESAEFIVRRDKRIARSISLDLVEGQEEETRALLSAIVAGMDLPEGVSVAQNAAQQGLNEDLEAMIFAALLSIVFIYLLMGVLFESFVLPLSIIFTIPLAAFGVIWIHLIYGWLSSAGRFDIDFLGAVGIILLIGVVVNNGIVLIDYVNRLRREGIKRNEAILLSAQRRFRPIMMTAITTVGGMVPLAINGRMDSGISYTSFALTLIGGMTTATLLTLLVVPVFYTFFDDLRAGTVGLLLRFGRRGVQRATLDAEVAA
jgi:HAE1 family hydrophobic/amphiphilic exporter-1